MTAIILLDMTLLAEEFGGRASSGFLRSVAAGPA
jgi:hypothetical protein